MSPGDTGALFIKGGQQMSVKIKISYTDPGELEAIKKALEGIIEPHFRQQRAAGRDYKRHYITGKVKK